MTQPEQMAVERLGNLQFLSPDELRDAVELVLSLLRRYETALEFYGDEATWKARKVEVPATAPEWDEKRGDLDLGRRAYTTLYPMDKAASDRGAKARAALGGE